MSLDDPRAKHPEDVMRIPETEAEIRRRYVHEEPEPQWVVMFFNPTTNDHTADCVYESATGDDAVAQMRRHICSTYSESFVMSVEQFKAACKRLAK